MQEVLFFKFDCEWLCNFVRQRVYWEGMPFSDGIAVLKDTFGVDDDVALSILTGTKKIVGINEGELVDDDKHEDYLQYVARTEKATAFSKLEKDVDLHPYNYLDPFATRWSYKEFEEKRKENPSYADLVRYFGKEPAIGTATDGGLYSIDADFLWKLGIKKKITSSHADKDMFYTKLWEYWNKRLKDGSLDAIDETFVKRRQRVYQAYKSSKDRGFENLVWVVNREQHPSWVIKEDNTYDFCKSTEVGGYLSHAKYVSCDQRVFTEYGIISPTGDFYACDFAGHESAAVVLCYQNGYFGKEAISDVKDNPILFLLCGEDSDGKEFRYKAKDLLYDHGWIFVNSAYGYGGDFYSKWDNLEDMPQRAMNTAYDYIIWKREGGGSDCD